MVVSEGFPAAHFRSCLPRRELNVSSAAARFCSLPCGSTQAAGLAGQSGHSVTSDPHPKEA